MDQSAYRDMAATEDEHWWFVGRRAILDEEIKQLKLPPSAKILEVGAGTGGNLALLKRHGAVSAMELDEYARGHAQKRSGIEVKAGSLPHDIPFEGQLFDLICLFDVLEHVGPDVESLKALSRFLKPEGRFLLTVPAYPWMWSSHDVVLHHFRRYTRTSLRKAIEAAGLKGQKITNFNALLFPAAIAARAMSSVLPGKQPPGVAMPSSSTNSALTTVFRSERHLMRFGGFPFGLSLLAVAMK